MYQFIVNPGAGAGRGYRIWKRLEHQLEMNSQEYRVFFTEHQGDAAEIARALTAEKDEAKVIVIVGGEGTYNEVLNGVSFKGLLTFGYVPVGFRNALSKGFQSFWKVDRQARRILHPKYYRMLDYGVITFGNEEIVSRRFAGRCGIGLDAALCHNLLCCPVRNQMTRLHLTKILRFGIGLKQLFLAKPTKGYILLDGTQKVEFNHIYFITFMVRREEKKKKNLKWWIIGWILFFPIPLTIIVVRSKKLKTLWKIIILVAIWGGFILIGLSGEKEKNETPAPQPSITSMQCIAQFDF